MIFDHALSNLSEYDFFEKPLKIQDILVSLGEASRRAIRWRDLYSRHSISTEGK